MLDTFKRWVLFDLPKLNALHKRIVFVVDGMDQLEDRHGAAALLWYVSAYFGCGRPVRRTHLTAGARKDAP